MHHLASPRIYMCITLLVALALAGCGPISVLVKERNPTAQLTVQYATLKVIEQSSTISATDVLQHVDRVRAVIDSNASITIGALSAQVRENIRWDRLAIADRLLLDALLTEAEARLAERIGSGALSPDDRVTISALLDWIAQAARMGDGISGADHVRLMALIDQATEVYIERRRRS